MRRSWLGLVLLLASLTACSSTPATVSTSTATLIPSATPVPRPTIIVPRGTPGTPIAISDLRATQTVVAATIAVQDATVVASRGNLIQALNDAETRWTAKNITAYHIAVQVRGAFNLRATMDIDVQGGQVTHVNCISPDKTFCDHASEIADYYTVSGLFRIARDAINDAKMGPSVSYDGTYGYPSTISIRSVRVSDVVTDIAVTGFEVLP